MRMRTTTGSFNWFKDKQKITLDDVLGVLQNMEQDIREEQGTLLSNCPIVDVRGSVSKMVWLGKTYAKIIESNRELFENDSRLKKIEELGTEIQKVTGAVGDSVILLDQRTRELEDLRKKEKDLVAQIDDTQRKVDVAKAKAAPQQKLLEKLLLQIETFGLQIAALNQRIEEETLNHKQLEAEKEKLSDDAALLTAQIASLKSEIQELKRQLERLNREYTTALEEKRRLTALVDDKQREVDRVNAIIQSLQKQLEKLLADLQNLNNQNASLKQQIEDEKINKANAEKEKTDLSEQQWKLKDETRALQKEITSLKVSVEDEKKAFSENKSQRDQLQSELDEYRKSNELLTQEIEKIRQNLENAKAERKRIEETRKSVEPLAAQTAVLTEIRNAFDEDLKCLAQIGGAELPQGELSYDSVLEKTREALDAVQRELRKNAESYSNI